jgi:hypothetical protein
MKTQLSAAALAVAASTSLAQMGPDEPADSGAYSLQEPEAQEYQSRTEERARGEIYGFGMVDMGYNDGSIDEDWFDVVRPSKLPGSREEEDCRTAGGEPSNLCNDFTTPGSTYASVRQSRLGVKGWFPTSRGDIHTIFEFEMFGVGDDAGETTIRLRHAYGEMGAFGGGQYWSPFMDINVFPNSVEYWGPTGMAFFRNVQFRWMPLRGEHSNLTFALERPGFGRDGSLDDVETAPALEKGIIRAKYPAPDLSAAYSFGGDWGYARIAGILRYVEWDDETPEIGRDISDEVYGWGVNLSSNIRLGPGDSVLKFAVVAGEGIQNYMNDATGDIGVGGNFDNPNSWEAETIPLIGTTLFWDIYWSDRWSSTIGFSTLDLDNRDLDSSMNLREGRYALVNLLYHPADNVMFGGELQYGYRENYGEKSGALDATDYDYDLWRIQFSARYNFSFGLGG